jgi:type IV secretory pathway TrbD component
MASDINGVPRRIWILWTQGLDQMPPIPRACIDSWTRHNAGWDIEILTAETLGQWADPRLGQPNAQSQRPYRLSELARVNLLATHGGVWVDATCFCMKPLDEWLPDCLESGFFAFARPGRDRLMSSWFLASRPHCYIPRRMFEVLDGYYLGRRLVDAGWRRVVRRALDAALNSSIHTTSLWFAWPLPELGISPYLSFHYLFNRLAKTDPSFREIWERTVKVSSDGPHSLQIYGLCTPPSSQIMSDIERRETPLYKLNWRIDPATLSASSTLNLLLRSADL